VAWLVREAASLRGRTVVVNLSGRGDKDLGILESEADRQRTDSVAGLPPQPRAAELAGRRPDEEDGR
jgi:hypothetical protein